MNSELDLTVTDDSFEKEVLGANQVIVVDFWAPWCAPCRVLSVLVERLAKKYAGRARILKLNVDGNQETAARFGIGSIPTLLIFKDGQVAERIVGLPSSEKALMAMIENQLESFEDAQGLE